jgi:hypothetical protein
MNLSATRTVRELAIEIPNATRTFEKLGIDLRSRRTAERSHSAVCRIPESTGHANIAAGVDGGC